MSMFEVNPGQPVSISPKVARKILEFMNRTDIAVKDLLEAVPELAAMDTAATTLQDVYNDCLLCKQELFTFDEQNLNRTITALEDSFEALTGTACEEFGITMDPAAGNEAEDDEK